MIIGSFGQYMAIFKGILVILVLSEGSIGCHVTFSVKFCHVRAFFSEFLAFWGDLRLFKAISGRLQRHFGSF